MDVCCKEGLLRMWEQVPGVDPVFPFRFLTFKMFVEHPTQINKARNSVHQQKVRKQRGVCPKFPLEQFIHEEKFSLEQFIHEE